MAGSGDGRLYALAAGSGGEYWRYPTGDAVYAAPVVVDGTIYISSSANALHTVDWLTGKRIWKHEFSTVLRTSPLLVDDLLIVAPESDSHLYILDRLTGVEYTRIDTGDWTTGGVWQVDEQLIVAGKDGSVLSYRILAQP